MVEVRTGHKDFIRKKSGKIGVDPKHHGSI